MTDPFMLRPGSTLARRDDPEQRIVLVEFRGTGWHCAPAEAVRWHGNDALQTYWQLIVEDDDPEGRPPVMEVRLTRRPT